MSKKKVTANIQNAFCWKYINISNQDAEFIPDRINKLKSDINIGFEKGQRKILLEYLENLIRDDPDFDLIIPLLNTPKDAPHHLDNEKEITKIDKESFLELIISKIGSGRKVEVSSTTIRLNLDSNALFELFTKLYINMEIYATFEDNILTIEDENKKRIRLVLWGVINGKPIYY